MHDDSETELEIEETGASVSEPVFVRIDSGGERLDRALAAGESGLSRARIQALIAEAAVFRPSGEPAQSPSEKAQPGVYRILPPPPVAALPKPENLPLKVLFEDEHLIVVDKAAGMAVHLGPGVPSGALVSALLHHCAGQLSGIGGVARPGIVHRLDKDTSGVMVAAKTDRAHAGLSALFQTHDIDRLYLALVRGGPKPSAGDVMTQIGRSPHDRKKMAVLNSGGREAITHYQQREVYGDPERPQASLVACRLETGRTHQIRVHMAHLGAPCLGDPVYGSGAPSAAVQAALREAAFSRQALHASVLGFKHPVTGEALRFETPPPADMLRLHAALEDKLGPPLAIRHKPF